MKRQAIHRSEKKASGVPKKEREAPKASAVSLTIEHAVCNDVLML